MRFPVEDITPTYLTNGVLSTLRQADYLATEVLHTTNTTSSLSQMPVIIIPVHFDRDPVKNSPSCQRSIVIRTFITNDFMTGIAATPNKQFPAQVELVLIKWTLYICDLLGNNYIPLRNLLQRGYGITKCVYMVVKLKDSLYKCT